MLSNVLSLVFIIGIYGVGLGTILGMVICQCIEIWNNIKKM